MKSSVFVWASRVARLICTTDAVEAFWKDLSQNVVVELESATSDVELSIFNVD